MYPDVTRQVVLASAPLAIGDDVAAYLTAVSCLNDTTHERYRKARVEIKALATLAPTRLSIWVQFRSNSGTWFDCNQPEANFIQFDDVFTQVSPTPVTSCMVDIEGDEMRIGYKQLGYAAGNFFTIQELNIQLLA